MSLNIESPLSPFMIFLDIDGVVCGDTDDNDVLNKAKELFPEAQYGKTRWKIEWKTAVSHFFNRESLESLDTIIREIEKTRNVSIVMSSAWRIGKNVEELKKTFSTHNFSKYIIAKTPEADGKNGHCAAKDCKLQCRAAEIHGWLEQHSEVIDYLILDDNDIDGHLSTNFGAKFVHINPSTLLTTKTAAKILKKYRTPDTCCCIL